MKTWTPTGEGQHATRAPRRLRYSDRHERDFGQCANRQHRGGGPMRIFGEYAFLEDSRYTSQAKNAVGPQFEFFQRAMTFPRNPRGSSAHPRTALTRSR